MFLKHEFIFLLVGSYAPHVKKYVLAMDTTHMMK